MQVIMEPMFLLDGSFELILVQILFVLMFCNFILGIGLSMKYHSLRTPFMLLDMGISLFVSIHCVYILVFSKTIEFFL